MYVDSRCELDVQEQEHEMIKIEHDDNESIETAHTASFLHHHIASFFRTELRIL